MPDHAADKMTCACGWRGTRDDTVCCEVVRLDDGSVFGSLLACPKCEDHADLVRVCDEPGCWREAACGALTDTGYRRTCGEHLPRAERAEDTAASNRRRVDTDITHKNEGNRP